MTPISKCFTNSSKHENVVFNGEQEIIHYSCKDGIEKSLPLDDHQASWYHDPMFYPILTLMIVSYDLSYQILAPNPSHSTGRRIRYTYGDHEFSLKLFQITAKA